MLAVITIHLGCFHFFHYWGHFGNGKSQICFQTRCAAVLTEWWSSLGPTLPPPQLA